MLRNKHLISLMMALAIAASAAAFGQDVKDYNRRELSNGLIVVTKEIHTAPVVFVSVWYRVGSRNETEGITGISHALEHMMFKGTEKFKEAGETDRIVRRIGGVGNAGTGTDYTIYYETVPAGMEKIALEIEADRMTGALLRSEDFDTEKTVIMEERKMRNEDSPDGLFWEELSAAAFKVHPYGRPIIGWMNDIEGLNSDKIRKYYKSHYAPNNAIVVVCGDFDSAELNKTIDSLYGGLAPDETVGKSAPSQEPPQKVEKRIFYPSEKTNLPKVVYAWHVPTYGDKDSPALEIADSILSSGRTSRLYKTFVEGGLAGSADATHDTNTDPYLFYVEVELQPGVDTDTAEQKIREEIERLKNEPASDHELQKAKNRFRAENIMGLQSISSFGRNLGWFEITTGNPGFWDVYLSEIEKVTAEDVMRVAKTYFNDMNLTVGVLVPAENTEESQQSGLAGPIKEYAYRGPYNETLPAVPGEIAEEETISLESFPPVDFSSRVKRTKLPNGLTILVYENPAFPVVSLHGIIKGAGSYADPADKKGLANLTSSMIRRETKNRTMDEINEELEFVGANIEFSSGNETAVFDALSLSEDFSGVVEIMSDMILNPSFKQDGLDIEKGIAVADFLAAQKNNRSRAWQAYLETMFPGHPYSNPPGGDEAGLNAVSLADLAAFHSANFRPDRTIIAISGAVKSEDVVKLLEKNLSSWKAPDDKPFAAAPLPQIAGNEVKKIDMPEKMQDVFFAGFKAPLPSDPDFTAFELMTDILAGSDLTSMLYGSVREAEGLVYYIYGFDTPKSGASTFQISAGLAPQNIDRALELMRQEISTISAEPLTELVLNDAKSYSVGHLPMTIETNGGIAGTMADFEYYGRPFTDIDNYADSIRNITADDIMRVAAKYLNPDKFVFAVAGPVNPPAQD